MSFRQDVPAQHRSVTRTTTVLQTRRASSTPICDSYNYRPSDNTCQLNIDLWLVQLPSFRQDVPAQHRSVTRTTAVLQTRRASSTHTTLHSSRTRTTSSTTATGPGGVRSSVKSCKQHWMFQTTLKSTVLAPAWYSFIPFTIHRRVCTE